MDTHAIAPIVTHLVEHVRKVGIRPTARQMGWPVSSVKDLLSLPHTIRLNQAVYLAHMVGMSLVLEKNTFIVPKPVHKPAPRRTTKKPARKAVKP